jgi:hypothetical protein
VGKANAAVEAQNVDIDGLPIRYLAAGEGPPLVPLHGAGGNSLDWRLFSTWRPPALCSVVRSLSGAPVGRFGVLTDPGFGPCSHLQGLALLVEKRPALRRRQPLRLDHRRTERPQARRVQGPWPVEDPRLMRALK